MSKKVTASESIGRVLWFLLIGVQLETKATFTIHMKEVAHAAIVCMHMHTYVDVQVQVREEGGNSHLLNQSFPIEVFN